LINFQVRAFGDAALKTLIKSGASASGPPPVHRDVEAEAAAVLFTMKTMLPDELAIASSKMPNGPKKSKYPALDTALEFVSVQVADLIHARAFDENSWNRCIAQYLSVWINESQAKAFAGNVLSHYLAIDRVKFPRAKAHDDSEGELLCDTLFSLAYGALLLLSHTTLRLIRGRRYGILGTNGSGKSTLMRQLRDSKVENFPPQSELRCVMVEHSLQGEDTSKGILDFITSG
jgi:elongation factor 3